MNSRVIWGFLATGCLLAHGCGDAGVAASELATRSTSNDDGAATACESDLDCPNGEECEFEHGGSFCKPHGGDDHGGTGGNAGTGGTAGTAGTGGTAGGVIECESDYDCPNGEECEYEHGGSFCKPHGGDDPHGDDDHDHGGVMECESDYDCPNGEECEFEHGGSFCKPHGGDDDQDDYRDDRSGSNSGKG